MSLLCLKQRSRQQTPTLRLRVSNAPRGKIDDHKGKRRWGQDLRREPWDERGVTDLGRRTGTPGLHGEEGAETNVQVSYTEGWGLGTTWVFRRG